MSRDELIAKTKEETEKCYKIAEKYYKRTFPRPEVVFDLRGRTAGMACYNPSNDSEKIRYNYVLLSENINTFLSRTVPHEVAHLIVYHIWGRYASAHGSEWKNMMTSVFNADNSRCHQYDTTNSQVRRRDRFEYICPDCNHVYKLTTIRHNRAQKGVSYICRDCRTRLVFNGNQNNTKAVPTLRAASNPSMSSNKSKADLAYEMVVANPTQSRTFFIEKFMKELGMSKAGASTYFYNAKKRTK